MSPLSDGGCRECQRLVLVDRRRRGPFEANGGVIRFTEPGSVQGDVGHSGQRNLKRKTVQTVTNQRAEPGLMGTTSHPIKAREMAAGKPASYFIFQCQTGSQMLHLCIQQYETLTFI